MNKILTQKSERAVLAAVTSPIIQFLNKGFLTAALFIGIFSTSAFAQQSGGGEGLGQFKTGLQQALSILYMIGFIWGVTMIWGGANKLKNGDMDGKMGIIAGLILAGSGALMTVFFGSFGLSSSTLTPGNL